MPTLRRGAALLILGSLLAGCAGTPAPTASAPRLKTGTGTITPADIECVPYAREHSKIKLYGDAYTWWDQAKGRYARRHRPRPGSVMVLDGYAGTKRAHVAVVQDVKDGRLITVDHANWLNSGDIYRNDPVRDASPDNSWSAVNVFNQKTGLWGTGQYPVRGFIGPDSGPETDPAPAPKAPAAIAGAAPADDPIGQWIDQQDSRHGYADATDDRKDKN